MTNSLIKNDAQYESALNRIDELFDAKPGSKEFDEVELLMLLVKHYEEENYKIEAPDPIEAIKFRMEQMGLKKTDMTPYFGTRARVSEVLNRQRNLSIRMIRRLHKDFGIPAESLIG